MTDCKRKDPSENDTETIDYHHHRHHPQQQQNQISDPYITCIHIYTLKTHELCGWQTIDKYERQILEKNIYKYVWSENRSKFLEQGTEVLNMKKIFINLSWWKLRTSFHHSKLKKKKSKHTLRDITKEG